ncbi:GNAT family N-acetyltransferase [soil metagenome]
MAVRILTAAELEQQAGRLAEILADAVEANAGVSFLWPLDAATARKFWLDLKPAVASGRTMLFTAEMEGAIAGVVLLHRAGPQNQPHRGDIAKLLVHRDFRRKGIGSTLMRAAEAKARELGLTLLTFDAVAHGPVEQFYKDLGFVCIGYIPKYAKASRGENFEDTAIFYKTLTPPAP